MVKISNIPFTTKIMPTLSYSISASNKCLEMEYELNVYYEFPL